MNSVLAYPLISFCLCLSFSSSYRLCLLKYASCFLFCHYFFIWKFCYLYLFISDCWDVAAAAAKLLQPCLTLCDPIDSSSPGFSISGIFQARTLEWVAISFSNAWKWKVKVKLLSHVRLFLTPWTVAYQAPLSMGFSRNEYWSGVPLSSPAEKWTIPPSQFLSPLWSVSSFPECVISVFHHGHRCILT